jgi:penicillin-binding protein 1C
MRRLASRRGRLAAAAAALALLAASLLAVRLWPREPLLARFPASIAVHDRDGALLRLTLAADGTYRLPVSLDDVSPKLIDAVLLYEDRQFFRHPGVNGWSLLRGAWLTFAVGERRIGGSTLTMQLARRLHDLDSSSLSGKLQQVLRALELEAKYGKREILEAYLNLAPYGGNVEGVGAASQVYFHRRAADLTLPEALTLAVVPQNPTQRRPRADNAALVTARTRLFAAWRTRHGVSAAEAAAVGAPLLIHAPAALPFAAPHAVQALLAQPAPAARTRIDTTLDLRTQRLVERQLRAFVARQRRLGVSNAAALLVDVRDLAVVASVGSAAFADATIAGQNDGTRARRSPGSALKPFIYALAIDQGLVHPMTVLKDTPQAFGPQSPENFDGEFTGPVSVQEALVRSRNVPAVAVGLQLREPAFRDFLAAGGVARLEDASHYGLALYLGGAEVTMRELAALYAALANGGLWQPLRDEAGAVRTAPRRLLSEAASWVTLDMLAHNPRPAQAFANGAVRAAGPVYWKTGTSNGFRDAWSAGVFDHYVLVVWVGNFDGRPNPAFVGLQTAAPLFFQLVDALRATRPRAAEGGALTAADRPDSMLRPPAALRRVAVCADSGDLPNAACPRTVETWYLPGVSPIRVSTLHRALRIDRRSGLQACPGTPAADVRTEVYEFWGSDMLEQFERAGLPRRRVPALDPACAGTAAAGDALAARAPEITSPLDGVSYLLRDAAPQAPPPPLSLRATSDAGVEALFWFVDGAFVGRGTREHPAEWLPRVPGRYQIRVVDDAGRAARRELVVARAD